MPNAPWESSPKASTRVARAALAASIRLTLPFNLLEAWLTRGEWKISPYFGVSCLVFKARKRAFSAPKICTVDDECLARLINDPRGKKIVRRTKVYRSNWPACAISRAPTSSPTRTVKFGATAIIRFFKYSNNCPRYSEISMTWMKRCQMEKAEESKIFAQLTNNLSGRPINKIFVSDWGGYSCHHRLLVNVLLPLLQLRFEPQTDSSEPNEIKRTWEQRCRTLAMSSSEISVPIEISAASFTCASTSAGKRSDRSRSLAFVR